MYIDISRMDLNGSAMTTMVLLKFRGAEASKVLLRPWREFFCRLRLRPYHQDTDAEWNMDGRWNQNEFMSCFIWFFQHIFSYKAGT